MKTSDSRSRPDPVAQHLRDVPRSGIRDFFDIVATRADVISLGIGEPDFVTPWHIREALPAQHSRVHSGARLRSVFCQSRFIRLYSRKASYSSASIAVSPFLSISGKSHSQPGLSWLSLRRPGYRGGPARRGSCTPIHPPSSPIPMAWVTPIALRRRTPCPSRVSSSTIAASRPVSTSSSSGCH